MDWGHTDAHHRFLFANFCRGGERRGVAYGSFGASHSTGIGNRRELSTPDPKLILRSPLDSPLCAWTSKKPSRFQSRSQKCSVIDARDRRAPRSKQAVVRGAELELDASSGGMPVPPRGTFPWEGPQDPHHPASSERDEETNNHHLPHRQNKTPF